jgi:hypothetical protein
VVTTLAGEYLDDAVERVPMAVVRKREQQDLNWWIQQARLTLGAGLL